MSHRIFKILSIISYCLIILNGMIIGIPFICYLFVAPIEPDAKQRFSAIAGVLGLVYLIILLSRNKTKWHIPQQLIVFGFLLTPIIERITSVPIDLFNYLMFIIPCLLFVSLYIISMAVWFVKDKKRNKRNAKLR